MASIRIHRAYYRDADYAIGWYRRRSRNAADRFELALDAALTTLTSFPDRGVRRGRTYRSQPLKKYPYSVIYTFDGQQISIIAVCHDRRSPSSWNRRRFDP